MSDLEHGRADGAGMPDVEGPSPAPESAGGITRRKLMGYLLAAPTLVAAAQWDAAPAEAAIPSIQVTNVLDLSDALTLAALPTANMISVTVNSDGTASFALPRAEVGQGITTAVAMTIADEMDLPIEKVKVTLADARPELLFNQLTAGSNSMHSIFTPVRTAAAAARSRLLEAAAAEMRVSTWDIRARDGVFTAADGRTATFGSLARKAAVTRTVAVSPQLKRAEALSMVGTDQRRIDARDIVTGRKQFAMDLDVADALPTMVCRPPTINGTVLGVDNAAEVRAMPGITDVVAIPHSQFVPGGVAVRGRTFGQCIDAVRALKVRWGGSPVAGKSDATVLADLRKSQIPLTPALPGQTIDETFTFHFRPGDPLETNCAVADVRKDRAEIWSCLKSPVWAKEQIALLLRMPLGNVTVHVAQGGGSFGRHLFADAAFEAAAISQKMGKPVKLMWHRTDNFRQGRVHPMCISRVRVTRLGSNVLAFDQRHTSVATDFTHGLGELLTAADASLPLQNFLQLSEAVFTLTANVPYNFGIVTQLLSEIYDFKQFNTSSVRNIYSPDVRTSGELMVDRVAKDMGRDPVEFRRAFAKDDRLRAVIDKAAQVGSWGRSMPAGTAQGFAVHSEYKGRCACLIEIDCRPETVNRKVEHGYTGPRVTKAVFVVDVGLPINPLGLKAQMMGGIMDGIAQALSYSLHLKDGHFLEGSWEDAFYTRQWNTPPELEVIVMPPTTGEPGGAGEFGVAASMAATACAYGRATGTMPTSFPINHGDALGFEPYPNVPSVPESPVDGLARAHVKRPRKPRA
ncbi:MAG: isoquinoline 1-oxidoreductase subunit beta, partial [Solirubrobacteraceae bacterium]|nr:isoquinoline 1-oxidoreductase subunit beta [Solirubrobacteraceae bacterium]